MLVEGRKAEISTAQASRIEEHFRELRVNAIRKPGKKCYYCRFDYPHTDRPCPAQIQRVQYVAKRDTSQKYVDLQGNKSHKYKSRKRHPFLRERRSTSQNC